MQVKWLIIILVLISIVLISGCVRQAPEVTKEQIDQTFSQFRQAYQEKLDIGYDLTEAENLARQSREAYDRGDYESANRLLDKALDSLRKAEIPDKPIKQCPICDLPTEWSSCVDNKQTRTNYKCDASTNYQCQDYIEECSCEVEIPEDPCINAPSESKSTCEQQSEWLDSNLAKYKTPVSSKLITYGAMQTFLSYERPYSISTEDINTFTDGLVDANVDLIKFYIIPEPFINNEQEVISKYDSAISYIKSKNKKLMIVFRPSERKGKKSWEQFKSEQEDMMNIVIPKYQPDYYGFVAEPETMNNLILTSSPSYDEWASFISEICPKAKSLGNVKTVTISHQEELEFSKKVADMPCLDIVGVNLYLFPRDDDLAEMESTYDYIQSKGKEAWVGETWIDWKDTNYPWREELDAKYLKFGMNFARSNEMKGYIVDYPRHFFNYDPSISAISSDIRSGEGTKSFEVFKNRGE